MPFAKLDSFQKDFVLFGSFWMTEMGCGSFPHLSHTWPYTSEKENTSEVSFWSSCCWKMLKRRRVMLLAKLVGLGGERMNGTSKYLTCACSFYLER